MKNPLQFLFRSSWERRRIWLERVIKNGWHDLMRSKLLTLGTTVIIALMFFVFNLILALSFASDSILQSVGEKVDIRVEIQDEVEYYTIQNFVAQVKNNPEVKEVVYISKEEALGRFSQKYPNVIRFLENNDLKNPLPNVVRIVGKDVSSNNKIIAYLEGETFSRIVNQEKLSSDIDQKGRNEKILNITQFIKGVGLWMNFIFAIVAILIIFNSININIHTHRYEINIMQLVGAKTNFIRGGYLFEGLFYALSALIVSLLFSRLTLVYLTRNLVDIITDESLLIGLNSILFHFDDQFWLTVGWQLLGVALVGLFSSYLAIELYLRRRLSFN
ncbi:hypothetical protein IPJ72_04670 [Candidatus Peregrinibacteria bacterium]|nr:MAG: hypothetical protein IPJ72_04670 [Candidatus Peregrinibacteria bacterium]